MVDAADYARALEDVAVLSRIRQKLETHNAELQRRVEELERTAPLHLDRCRVVSS